MPHDHGDAPPHTLLPSEPELRVKALESLLVAKGLVDPAAVDAIVDQMQNHVGPRAGARVVSRAWTDPAFRARILDDAMPDLIEMGLTGAQGEHVVVVENTPDTHNVVVCTLCSCYPWPLLGVPPAWYKSDAYRARVVREPRKVLAEFGLDLPADQAVRVWDSTAETRYLVLPMQPDAARGLDADALEAWVTRNAMVGTGLPEAPA
ncbi:nitrile hydratase subunit alpha [Pseudaestuariivita atlantica]|uniref:nitrile hydratase n=1 Tax=Pseudaestuariivita atlantica TaxID=1317121 RepID=A0A0L1JMD0_9RHOB|nr:nitrile hydratase subunit alpha [Pseudaestuariivita atlantica]KNG92877.1 nitrile hydratase [Pseudaestuariivita atlantica]